MENNNISNSLHFEAEDIEKLLDQVVFDSLKQGEQVLPDDRKLVCPWRLITISHSPNDKTMYQTQEFPECCYGICPYFKDFKCRKVEADVNGELFYPMT